MLFHNPSFQSYSAQVPTPINLLPPFLTKSDAKCADASSQRKLSGDCQHTIGVVHQAICKKCEGAQNSNSRSRSLFSSKSASCVTTPGSLERSEGLRTTQWTSNPRSTSKRTHREPRKPVAPVIRTQDVMTGKWVCGFDRTLLHALGAKRRVRGRFNLIFHCLDKLAISPDSPIRP